MLISVCSPVALTDSSTACASLSNRHAGRLGWLLVPLVTRKVWFPKCMKLCTSPCRLCMFPDLWLPVRRGPALASRPCSRQTCSATGACSSRWTMTGTAMCRQAPVGMPARLAHGCAAHMQSLPWNEAVVPSYPADELRFATAGQPSGLTGLSACLHLSRCSIAAGWRLLWGFHAVGPAQGHPQGHLGCRRRG